MDHRRPSRTTRRRRTVQIGYELTTEACDPEEVVRQAVAAEGAGDDVIETSDRHHPRLDVQGHSGFTWNLWSFTAARTERTGLVTGVTCPSARHHPAITSDGRFPLGVGAGERLDEHVVGRGSPAVAERHERFREALEIVRLLWRGGYRTCGGEHVRLEDARVFDLPDELPRTAVAAVLEGRVRTAQPGELRRRDPDGHR